jgi:hypothetical protein
MNFIDGRHEPPDELTRGAIAEITRVTEEPSNAADPRQPVAVSARAVTRGKPFTEADIRALREFPDRQLSPARVVLREGDEVLPEIALVYLEADRALPPDAFPEMGLVVPRAEKATWMLWPAEGGGFWLYCEWGPSHETLATIEETLEVIGQSITETFLSGPYVRVVHPSPASSPVSE